MFEMNDNTVESYIFHCFKYSRTFLNNAWTNRNVDYFEYSFTTM